LPLAPTLEAEDVATTWRGEEGEETRKSLALREDAGGGGKSEDVSELSCCVFGFFRAGAEGAELVRTTTV